MGQQLRRGGRLQGMSRIDQELQDALDEESRSISRKGTAHSSAAVMLMQHSPPNTSQAVHRASPPAAGHALTFEGLMWSGQQSGAACTPDAHPASQAEPPSANVQGSAMDEVSSSQTLCASAVGRLLDAIVMPPSTEEAIARAVCERLVHFVSFQAALESLPGITDELERFQAATFQAAYHAAGVQRPWTGRLRKSSGRGNQPPTPSQRKAFTSCPPVHGMFRSHSMPGRAAAAVSNVPNLPHIAATSARNHGQSTPGASTSPQGREQHPQAVPHAASCAQAHLLPAVTPLRPAANRQISCPGEVTTSSSLSPLLEQAGGPAVLSQPTAQGRELRSHSSWPLHHQQQQQQPALNSVQEQHPVPQLPPSSPSTLRGAEQCSSNNSSAGGVNRSDAESHAAQPQPLSTSAAAMRKQGTVSMTAEMIEALSSQPRSRTLSDRAASARSGHRCQPAVFTQLQERIVLMARYEGT